MGKNTRRDSRASTTGRLGAVGFETNWGKTFKHELPGQFTVENDCGQFCKLRKAVLANFFLFVCVAVKKPALVQGGPFRFGVLICPHGVNLTERIAKMSV